MTRKPVRGRGGDRVDDDAVGGERLALQFIEMKLNGRCSILFHLLVPGGMWHTLITNPKEAPSNYKDVVVTRATFGAAALSAARVLASDRGTVNFERPWL